MLQGLAGLFPQPGGLLGAGEGQESGGREAGGFVELGGVDVVAEAKGEQELGHARALLALGCQGDGPQHVLAGRLVRAQ